MRIPLIGELIYRWTKTPGMTKSKPLTDGEIMEAADVGGLHHHYGRRAA
ncbi:MAG: hypothetical protein JOY54_03920 [Acidobacteriaceae bacterium]|nr:hypothetical protein [Acidobacteriaceae bacterium]